MEIKGGYAGIISHTISNPKRKLAGYKAIETMMDDVKEYVQKEGYKTIMCLTTSRLLASVYDRVGLKLAETGVNQYFLI